MPALSSASSSQRCAPASSNLDVGLLDDVAERDPLTLDDGAEGRRIEIARIVAAGHQLLVHGRVLGCLADRPRELVDRYLRRAPGRQESVPGIAADLAHALLLQGRDVGFSRPALLAQDGEALQPARRDM